MAKRRINRREFFRIDTFLPLKINAVAAIMRPGLFCRLCAETGLKPAVVNISGGYLDFLALKKYAIGDLLEVTLALPIPVETTVCLYGEVIKATRTKKNHYRTVIAFINMPEKIRELVMTFVFHRQRAVLITTQAGQEEGVSAVPLTKFVPGTSLPFEVFIREEREIAYLFDAGLPYDALTEDFFQDKGISQIFIRNSDMYLLDNYVSRFRIKHKVFDPEDAVSFRNYSFEKRMYHKIDRAILLPHSEINFDIFTMDGYIFERGIEAAYEQPVTLDENIDGLKGDLLVRKADLPLYRTHLNSLPLDGKDKDAELLSVLALKEHAKLILHELFVDPSNRENITEAAGISERIIERMRRHEDTAYALLSSGCNDFYLYIHALNVAVMSAAVGLAMKLHHDSVVRLCTGALLHDLGHGVINDEIVNKQGRLTLNEYEVSKTHVIEGVKILRSRSSVPHESLAAILHHHERFDGSGYPSGLSGNRISLFGRIIAVADAYDLLTPNSPYRKGLTPFKALSVLKKDAAYYDPEILKAFIKIVARVR